MQDVAQRYQSQLERIKKQVRDSYEYFRPNYERYNQYRKFVFDTSLSPDEITLLSDLQRPQIEFNVLEAYISRLLGEFSKQEPEIEVSAQDQDRADPMMIKFIQQHLHHTLLDTKNHHTRYEVYKDLLSGGFSVLKVVTDYESPMSMNQNIMIERAFNPTLCGFDHLAKYSHKGDGRFCFELFPRSKDDFKEEYPDINLNNVTFKKAMAGFNWSYTNDNTNIILLADYYEKKKKQVKIVQIKDGPVVKYDDYKKMLDEWDDITVPPAIIGKPRTTTLTTICRYRIIDNQVLEYEETDYQDFPLIFVDGHSVMIQARDNTNIRQMTRPYIYHAKDAQRLKNLAGIALANEIENTVQHKFMVAKEALPKEEELLEAYKDVQKANVLVYNSVYEGNPDQPINNPLREVQRVPGPPEIGQAFTGTDSLIQNILGSYDASLGINNNQLSGIAIVEAASQSNATAMPYIVGYLQGYQRAAQVYVDLMPKYYTTPRTLPITDEDGKRLFIRINGDNGVPMSFEPNTFEVMLTAGASFQVQKSRTISMVKEMMGMSPLFQQFIGEKGLNFLLDNMEGKGIEELKDLTKQWTQQYEQEKQQAMQAQQQQAQQNPAAIKAQVDMAKLETEKQKTQVNAEVEMIKAKTRLQEALIAAGVGKTRAEAEVYAKHADIHIKRLDLAHKHIKQAIETRHKIKVDHHKMHLNGQEFELKKKGDQNVQVTLE
jgi:hypothetical protein